MTFQTSILRRRIGTFYLLAQKLVFHNSDLNKSTTVCKMGDLEVFPKPFWIWKHIHAHEVHACEVHAHEVHAREVHIYEVHTMRCTPVRYTPMKCVAMRCTPVIYESSLRAGHGWRESLYRRPRWFKDF